MIKQHQIITAVIPTLNRADDLKKAVSSILEQTRMPDELIVVDQSQGDESRILVEALIMNNKQIKLNYIHDSTISGLVAAKHVAVTFAKGDLVCFLEDDIVLEKDYVQQIEAAFLADDGMMGCCGVTTNLPPLSSNYVFFFHLFHRGLFHDTRVGIHGFTDRTDLSLIPSRYLSGGISAFRKEVFDKVPYDLENNFFMLEDIDFSTRAADCFGDQHFYINPRAKLAHYMSPVNRAVYGKRYAKKLREFIVFYKKNKRHFFDFISLLWLLIGMLIEALVVSMTSLRPGPVLGAFKGVYDGVRWKVLSRDS
tara:strand:- start:6721 stop:7647 length:927 start_codon:yes stop_codon:yes gene_type:complete